MDNELFQRTLIDLRSCINHLSDKNLTYEEKLAKESLIDECESIAEDYGGKN